MSFPPHLRIAAFAEADGNKTFDLDNKYYRLGKAVSDLLASALGFEYTLLPSVDGEFGRLRDGEWTGMIGMVLRGEADLAIGNLAVTQLRTTAVAYSYPTAVDDVTFVTHMPEKVTDLFNIFLPFSEEVWLLFLLCNALMPLALYALLRKLYSFQTVVQKTFGTFFGHQMFRKALALHQKIIVLTWMLGMMLISHSYKANLLSTLTFPVLRGVGTVAELAHEVEKGDYRCVTLSGSFYAKMLMESSRSTFRVIAESLEQNKGSSEPGRVLEAGRRVAYVGPKLDFLHLKNKYFVSRDKFFFELQAIGMGKDFCCRDQIDQVIHRMTAAGLLTKLEEDYGFELVLQDMNGLASARENVVDAISTEDLQSLIFFAGLGYVFSIAVFAIEVLVGAKEAKARKRRQCLRKIKTKRKREALSKRVILMRDLGDTCGSRSYAFRQNTNEEFLFSN